MAVALRGAAGRDGAALAGPRAEGRQRAALRAARPRARPPAAAAWPGAALVRRDRLGLVVGSGGVLSHAPRRAQAALMLLDAIEPCGFCRLAVDSVFMMPHLGVLSTRDPVAADEVFWRDCLVPLATVAAPSAAPGARMPAGLSGRIVGPDGVWRVAVAGGDLAVVPLSPGRRALVELQPERGGDLGAGPGRAVRREVEGGEVGLLLDCRGRPLRFPSGAARARTMVARWLHAAGALPAGSAAAIRTAGG